MVKNSQPDQPDQQPRINNMQSLLQVSIQHQNPSSSNSNQFEQMSAERRQFLESAIQDITVDHIEVLKKQINNLNELCVRLNSKNPLTEDEEDEYSKLLEEDLLDNVSNIDFANDFFKLGGFNSLTELIDCELVKFKVPALNLVAELVQNNDFCQQASFELNYLTKFIHIIEKDKNQTIILKTIYALSCLLRGNDKILNEFLKRDDNIRALLNVMVKFSLNEKIVFKSSFLLNSICGIRSELYDTLTRLGFVFVATDLMKTNFEQTHEYILAILVGMCENIEQAKRDCKTTQLKVILEKKIKFFKNKDEYLEEVDYCNKLIEFM